MKSSLKDRYLTTEILHFFDAYAKFVRKLSQADLRFDVDAENARRLETLIIPEK